MNARDSLFANPLGDINSFRFDQAVVDVFPDMLQRSIPGYEAIISQSALLATRYVQPDTRLYDLGSSLGATSIAMRNALAGCDPMRTTGCEIHAVDNAPAMIEACRSIIEESDSLSRARDDKNDKRSPGTNANAASSGSGSGSGSEYGNHIAQLAGKSKVQSIPPIPIRLYESDLVQHPLHNASVVAMNFTLQFVNKDARANLMQRIADALQPGGALILSEKVRFPDPVVNEMHIDMYHSFKRSNGYSDLEISQKRTALENVLVPDTLDEHRDRLLNSGFKHCTVWFQCFNFASLIAIKSS